MINEGMKNTAKGKAVPCNLIEEILKMRNKILEVMPKYCMSQYESIYKRSFDEIEKNGTSENVDALGDCIAFLLNYSNHLPNKEDWLEEDVRIYSSEYYVSEDEKYNGLCKLPNGADILPLMICGEETGVYMYSIVYFDGNKLQMFTPYCGNTVNVLFKTAIGDESNSYLDSSDFDEELVKQMFPDGLRGRNEFESQMAYEDYIMSASLSYYGYETTEGILTFENELFKEVEEALM